MKYHTIFLRIIIFNFFIILIPPFVYTQSSISVQELPVIDSSKAIYRQFFFTGTHNSYSGNLDGMNREGIKTQLERGLRFFEFDLFPYHTMSLLNHHLSNDDSVMQVFEIQGSTKILTFSKNQGRLKILDIVKGNPVELAHIQNTKWIGHAIQVKAISLHERILIVAMGQNHHQLSMLNYQGNRLAQMDLVGQNDIGKPIDMFVYQQTSFLLTRDYRKKHYQIYPLTFDISSATIGKPVFQLPLSGQQKPPVPFVQQDSVYLLFAQTDSAYTVNAINTHSKEWTGDYIVEGTSSKVNPETKFIPASDGKLWVRTMHEDDSWWTGRLIMDQGQPNLIAEISEETFSAETKSLLTFGKKNGYYQVIRESKGIQIYLTQTNDLILGHDCPGDEVDFSVDNPQSVRLEDWLSYLATWSQRHPHHEPIFIMTELKDFQQWVAEAKWRRIIEVMQKKFGDRLRFHSSAGFRNEAMVDPDKIINGETLYFMDQNGSVEEGMLGKVVLYIQPNIRITQSDYTNHFQPFPTRDGRLQQQFLQLKRYREDNKLVSPDWSHPEKYANDIGRYIASKDDSYLCRIFHMEDRRSDAQYQGIHCANVMFAVSDRPYDPGPYQEFVRQQSTRNTLGPIQDCE